MEARDAFDSRRTTRLTVSRSIDVHLSWSRSCKISPDFEMVRSLARIYNFLNLFFFHLYSFFFFFFGIWSCNENEIAAKMWRGESESLRGASRALVSVVFRSIERWPNSWLVASRARSYGGEEGGGERVWRGGKNSSRMP